MNSYWQLVDEAASEEEQQFEEKKHLQKMGRIVQWRELEGKGMKRRQRPNNVRES